MSKAEDLKRSILAIADPDKVSPFNGDMVTLFLHEIEKLVDSAVAAEREECAKVCDITPPQPFRPSIEAAHAIRARGNP